MQFTEETTPIFTVTISVNEYRKLIEDNTRNTIEIQRLNEQLESAEAAVKMAKSSEEYARNQYDDLQDRYFGLETWLESDGRESASKFEQWLQERKTSGKYTDEVLENPT